MTEELDEQPTADELLDRHAQEILAVLGEKLRLEGLEFDDESKCVFTLDKRFVFIAYFDYAHTNCIILNVPLGYPPEGSRREKLYEKMMAGNYCWGLTQGGTLGLDETTGMLSLSYLIPLPMQNKNQIVDIVSKLVSSADYWIRQIEETNQADGQNGGGAPVPMMRI